MHKVGCTKNKPKDRVKDQEVANKESYVIVEQYHSKFYKFLEYLAHQLFESRRVEKTDSKDGKTEWFLIDIEELRKGMQKICMALYHMHNDTLVWKPAA